MATDLYDKTEILRDIEYFSNELVKRTERMENLTGGIQRTQWQKSAGIIRKIRAISRHQLTELKRAA